VYLVARKLKKMKIDETKILLRKFTFRHFILGLATYVICIVLMSSDIIAGNSSFYIALASSVILAGIFNVSSIHVAIKNICDDLTTNEASASSFRIRFVVWGVFFVFLGSLLGHLTFTYLMPNILQTAKDSSCFHLVPTSYCLKYRVYTHLANFCFVSIFLSFYLVASRIWILTVGRRLEKKLFDFRV